MLLTAMASTTMTRTAGTFGSQRCRTRTSTIPPMPTAAAAGTTCPSASALPKLMSFSTAPSPSTEKPNSLGSWPIRMVTARPFMYPIMVGLEISSAMKPSLAKPATSMMTATMTASSDASATARSGSPPAATSGSTVAAIMGPNEESGPSTRMRDGPNSA